LYRATALVTQADSLPPPHLVETARKGDNATPTRRTTGQLSTMPSHEFDAAANALAADGWCLVHHLMTPAQTLALADECRAMHEAHLLMPAATGAGRAVTALRGDSTRWFLPDSLSAPQQIFTCRIDVLRTALSRRLMLGLVDSESQYAVYPSGAGYARHLDQLVDTDARVLSAVFYLNPAWRDEEGGALRLYLGNETYRDIYPQAGTLLLFLSAQFEHEVLPATRQRMSIACWMRQREMADS
jgi:SM-20-related protein